MAKKASNSSSNPLPKAVREYLSKRGQIAGKAGTGKAKARSKEQAQKAAKARWDKWREKNKKPPDSE